MATYTDPVYNDPAVAFPTTGVHYLRIKHTNQAAYAAADVVKLAKLPKGASIIPEKCSVFSDDTTDPGQAGSTIELSITDGTTTKVLIAAGAIDAVNLRLTAATAQISALKFFKTSNDDFYVRATVGVAAQIISAPVYYVIAYTMDGGRSEVTT